MSDGGPIAEDLNEESQPEVPGVHTNLTRLAHHMTAVRYFLPRVQIVPDCRLRSVLGSAATTAPTQRHTASLEPKP